MESSTKSNGFGSGNVNINGNQEVVTVIVAGPGSQIQIKQEQESVGNSIVAAAAAASVNVNVIKSSSPSSVAATPPIPIPNDQNVIPAHNIGSKNSAFQPYKAITVLTNLQRGNFKTLHKDVATPLTFHEKAARGDLKAEEVNDSNVDLEDAEGKTALIWACFHGKLPTVKMLIEKGANVNYQGLAEETPLMYAASNARSSTHLEIINTLIEVGAEVDAADFEGNTPLIYATSGNHGQAVSALLQKGASFTRVNENGDSAFNIAVAKGLLAAQNSLENFLREVIEKNLIK